MKKFLFTAIIGVATALVAQTTPAQSSGTDAQGNSQAAQGTSQASSQKTIKDPAEFNAYMTATTTTDPNQKAAALESFAQQYPNSVVKEDALYAEMSAYQTTGNLVKTAEVASRLIQVNPNHVPALAVLAYTKRQNPQTLNEAGQLAIRGLSSLANWPKGPGISDADYKKQIDGLTTIFDGAAGAAAFQNKDFASAQKYLRDSVTRNPNNADDTYNLALAYLSIKPVTDDAHLNGLWFLARAVNLAADNPAAQKQISDYAIKVYTKFHGSAEGWDQVVAQAKSNPLPPPNFTITKYIPPSPAQVAATMVANNDVTKMNFGDWQFILTSGNKEAADKVWTALKGKALRFEGLVINATRDTISLAATTDDIDAKKADVQVTMLTPLKVIPATGTMFQVQAVPASYDENPFLMKMDQGSPFGTSAPKKAAPAKKKTTRKKG